MILKTYNDNVDKFLSDLENRCQQNNIEIVFTNKNYVLCDGIQCSGYFDDDKRQLFCALKTTNERWLSILVHESCHLDQWIEKNIFWTQLQDSKYDQDEWLTHKIELTPNQINEMTNCYKELEWDCEQRSIEKIKKYKLKIDLDTYIQKAVVYIMFYDFVAKYRRWYNAGQSPINKKEIYTEIPSNYDINNIPILTKNIEEKMKKLILGE